MKRLPIGLTSAAICLSTLAASACATQEFPTTAQPNNMGWFDGQCVAIKRDDLKPGTPITLVDLGQAQKRIHTHVTAKTEQSADCDALLPDRADINTADGNYFYRLSRDTQAGFGVAIINSPAFKPSKKMQFTSCNTSEGIQFSAWSGQPYVSEKLWEGYEYLGYDTQPTCHSEK